MGMNKSRGNMYPWVTHTHSHLAGECSHKCSYCYVNSYGKLEKYEGETRLVEKELMINYGADKVIFIEHCNDLFADAVPSEIIERILVHCCKYPKNTYVFQTKNPSRYYNNWIFPPNSIFGCTIESNRYYPEIMGNSPVPEFRYKMMTKNFPYKGKKFITIEPVLDFDVDIFASWIVEINPDFLNLGADSKGNGLIEPTVEKIFQLVDALAKEKIELREKHNLDRLKKV